MVEAPNDIELPRELIPKKIAEIVHAFDGDLVRMDELSKLNPHEAWSRCRFAGGVVAAALQHDPTEGIVVLDDRYAWFASIALRLWAGCISAAKIIALETRAGPNTPNYRKSIVKPLLRACKNDRTYAAGVAAGPELKKLRNEPFEFDGIPVDVQRQLWPQMFYQTEVKEFTMLPKKEEK